MGLSRLTGVPSVSNLSEQNRIIDSMKLVEAMSRIGTESAFKILAKARALEAQGRSVVHLEIGEPDFPTPPRGQWMTAIQSTVPHPAFRNSGN